MREVREVRRTSDGGLEVVDAPLVDRAHRDELLRQHVERVPRVARLLDLAGEHPLGDHRDLEQVTAELREDRSLARLADLVARATDPLQAARDGARRLHLHDQVHRAHVDPELEGRGRDDRAERAALQGVFHLEALFPGERAVVGAHEVLAGELVQPGGQSLGQPPGVHEDDRRTVRADQLQQSRMDRRPDRPLRRRRADPGGSELDRLTLGRFADRAELGHVVDGDLDRELHRLPVPCVDDRDRPRRAVGLLSSQESRDLLERPLRGRQADPLRRRFADVVQPFEGEREMGAALRGRERVDLVHDHPPHAAQGLAGRGGEHQVERLRRRDQDVGRGLQELAAFVRRCVAGPDAHDGLVREWVVQSFGRMPDPGERRPQVLLDVDRERTERRDVEHPGPAVGIRRRLDREAVDRPQERGQRLARSGGGEDQRVVAVGDRRPSA